MTLTEVVTRALELERDLLTRPSHVAPTCGELAETLKLLRETSENIMRAARLFEGINGR